MTPSKKQQTPKKEAKLAPNLKLFMGCLQFFCSMILAHYPLGTPSFSDAFFLCKHGFFFLSPFF
jgi:hypothetical protein